MKKTGNKPAKVALFGMDPRSYKTMELYLKGPCRGIAVVVDETEAEIDMIDADFATAGEILANRQALNPDRPIILLSLQHLSVKDTYFVQKPVTAEQLTTVFQNIKKGKPAEKPQAPDDTGSPETVKDAGATAPVEQAAHENPPSATEFVSKAAKKRTLFEDNEGGYVAFLGTLLDIDFNDPEQLRHASFEPRLYLLGYVLSAYKVACHQKRALRLNSMWKPLVIFPDERQIWVDADDKQLRVFAGMEQNKLLAGNISLVPIDADDFKRDKAVERFQDIDVFIWKLAVWTSKGRFPVGLEPDHPVFMTQWPNFTRLLLMPDALRITALLLQGPRTPLNIIKVLNIKPQYVFALLSACHSIGILAKSQRKSDEIITPDPPKHSKKQGLLSKILHKLRGD